jgi:hypothetical protein
MKEIVFEWNTQYAIRPVSLFGCVSNFEPKFKIIPNRIISQVKLKHVSATSEKSEVRCIDYYLT